PVDTGRPLSGPPSFFFYYSSPQPHLASFPTRRSSDLTTGAPFPGNIIPASRIAPFASKFLSGFVPAPNTSEPGIKPLRNLMAKGERKSTRLNSSHVAITYAVFRLKKKKTRDHAQHSGR